MAAVAITQPRVRSRHWRLAVEREMTHLALGARRRLSAVSPRAKTAPLTIAGRGRRERVHAGGAGPQSGALSQAGVRVT
jgi:hypothetical protein